MSLAFWIAIAVMFIAILPVILRGKGGDGTGSADGGSSTGGDSGCDSDSGGDCGGD